MKPVCPFIKASRPDDASNKKPGENRHKQQSTNDTTPQKDSAITPKCPYGYDSRTFKLGPLGDCCRAIGDASAAISYFEESVSFLTKVPKDGLEITHTHSVSLNKIGDLKYYEGDLQAARSYYFKALEVRRNALKNHSNISSLVIDVATSLAKVTDIDRNLANEDTAIASFQEGIKLLESLSIRAEEVGLEQRRLSVLEFLNSKLAKR